MPSIQFAAQAIHAPTGDLSIAALTYTGTGEFGLDETIPPSQSDEMLSIAIDVSQVKAILIYSDHPLTLKTNSHSAPGNTLVLAAGVAYEWTTDSLDTLKLTVDVTSIHVDNPDAAAARLFISGVYDASP
jgi:hypothetical protein